MIKPINKFFSASDIIEKFWLKENYDMEIFHPYTSVVNINQADKDIFNHKTIDLESKKDRDIKFFENTANTTEAGDTISLDPINHSDCPKLIYAQRVEGDRSCTYFPAKIDANLQILRILTLSTNQITPM